MRKNPPIKATSTATVASNVLMASECSPGEPLRSTTIHQRYEVTIAVQQNPSGGREKQVFFQGCSAKGSEQMYLALLESVSCGKRVRVFVTGECGVSGCSRISAVGIRP
jgi:hypothetical protein